jgi:hypothetical protein
MRVGSFAWKGFGFASQFVAVIATAGLLQNGCGGSDAETPSGGSGGKSGSGGRNTGGRATGGDDNPGDPDGGGASNSGGAGGGKSTGGNPSAGGASSSGGSESGGGARNSGGASNSGGSESSGGDSNSGGTGNGDPECNKKTVDPTQYPACTTCTGGHCVPKDFLENSDNLDACGSGVCLPDEIIEVKGYFAPKKCTSVLGNEGRCSSVCLPAARALASILPQDVCAADERCAPCFNPNDGEPTGVCGFGCDAGPTTEPILFSKCCSGLGQCVPTNAIPDAAKGNAPRETCPADNACIPSKIVEDPTYRFPSCKAEFFFPLTGPLPAGPGVCVPACIVDATQFGEFITEGDCSDPGDKCAPCIDPRTNEPSGACLEP